MTAQELKGMMTAVKRKDLCDKVGIGVAENELYLHTSNGEVWIKKHLQSTARENCSFASSPESIKGFLKNVPAKNEIDISLNEEKLHLSTTVKGIEKRVSIDLTTSNFPEFPFEKLAFSSTLPQAVWEYNTLLSVLSRITPFIGDDACRKALNGIHFTNAHIEATNGHFLARETFEELKGLGEKTAILPPLLAVIKQLKGTETVTMVFGDEYTTIHAETGIILLHNIDAVFPEIDRVLFSDYGFSFEVSRPHWEMLAPTNPVTKQVTMRVDLENEERETFPIILSAANPNNDEYATTYEGKISIPDTYLISLKTFRAGFNGEYLLNCLTFLETEKAMFHTQLTLWDKESPEHALTSLIIGKEGRKLVAQMPVRVSY